MITQLLIPAVPLWLQWKIFFRDVYCFHVCDGRSSIHVSLEVLICKLVTPCSTSLVSDITSREQQISPFIVGVPVWICDQVKESMSSSYKSSQMPEAFSPPYNHTLSFIMVEACSHRGEGTYPQDFGLIHSLLEGLKQSNWLLKPSSNFPFSMEISVWWLSIATKYPQFSWIFPSSMIKSRSRCLHIFWGHNVIPSKIPTRCFAQGP